MKHANEKNIEKTNVMRILDGKRIAYECRSYEPDAGMSGEEIAGLLGEDPAYVYKTLVTQGKSGQYLVFVIPVAAELDLKKAARVSGEKSISMIRQKELLPLTGYVHGGCSPIGMKKQFKTFLQESAAAQERIFVSAGKVGQQIELPVKDLAALSGSSMADIVLEEEE